MSRLPQSLQKLKGKSLDELKVRSAQAAHTRLERIGLSRDTREPSDRAFTRLLDNQRTSSKLADGDTLLERFRRSDRELWRCLPGLGDPALTAREFQARYPQSAAAAVAAAERIASGVVDLGNHTVSVGRRPDWTLEPVTAKRAPAVHWSRLAFLDPLVAGDSKFVWELNRHQYFLTLGRAYLVTGDDRYVSLIAEHLTSWMDDNPPKIGINWTSSLELAIRCISWIWAFGLVRHSPRLTGGLYLRALKFVYLQARHIERYLSTYFSPNTHLTGEALGLLYIGTAFPEFKAARHWRTLASRILGEQIERQLFADGVYFEQSTYYHRYTTDFYLHALLLIESSEPGLDDLVRTKVDALLDYLLHITRPDGTSPFIGDDDGGRLVMLGKRASNDFRDTLAIGAAMLHRSDCAYVAGNSAEEVLWLLGPAGVDAYDRVAATPPTDTSRAFSESGYFVMRQSWDPSADWALVRCGAPAPQTGAHAHADALSLELSVGGEPMLVDPGTYVYTASRAERDHFRSSTAHNTLTVDGLSSAEPAASPFKWNSVARSRATAWITHDTFDFFAGEHDGYLRLESPAIHARAAFFLKGEYLAICDRIRSDAEHDLALRWQWAPSVTLSQAPDTPNALRATANRSQVEARFFASSGELSCETGWVSTAYGTRTAAPVSVFRLDHENAGEVVTLLVPTAGSARVEDCSWRAVARRAAGVLTIATASTRDTILTGPTAATEEECDGIVSDATWTWVRRSLSGELLAFVLIQGRQLIVDNQVEFHAESVADYAIDRREARERRIEEPCAASVE